MARYVVTLVCQDRPGIVHALTGGLLAVRGNIVHSSQFGDEQSGRFFLRTEVDSPEDDLAAVHSRIAHATAALHADLRVIRASERCRVIIMVSGHEHCLNDLLYRTRIGDLPLDVVGVVSNHDTCRSLAEHHYRVPFELVPVTPATKPEAESRLLEIVNETRAELVVLARYMQVLRNELCQDLAGRAINIHHSFLPGFKGARPYQQAHERGVKLIGATAHYVTGDLDEGPIIEQDVVRVGHAGTIEQLTAIGRDVEARVLATAVRAHAEGRVFLNGQRTVVFT